ncbi:MAG: 3-beta hydroxysteroid dehydrogenase/isomerase [Elusimicrobia bacterium]|nr:MAG: 3-beta hydroxysteroid dehydrogenase/isomerase [Elusimicrobiota bacterium]KAF0154178.1 MAG: 3-beta hydroxysteroid dehydrogenase/isomerase [Elusimicrobiota bacterium]
MKALITGGGGFLGGAIVRLLLSKGARVRVLARGHYPGLEALGVECLRGSVADPAAAASACAGRDTVFHAAAKVGMWGRYEDFYRDNVAGTETLLKAARAAGVKKFIFTSTPSVVYPAGGAEVEGWDESSPYPEKSESHYAATKALAEKAVLAANDASFSTVALRPHLVWGPGRDHMVSTIIARGRAGKLRRIGSFNKLIDTAYIDDAAAAHLLAAERLAPGAACAGKAYFISQGDPRPNWDIVDMILDAAGAPPVKKSVPYPAALAAAAVLETAWRLAGAKSEPPMTLFVLRQLTTAHWFDISAARRDLGYSPSVTIEEGMRRLADWLRSAGE